LTKSRGTHWTPTLRDKEIMNFRQNLFIKTITYMLYWPISSESRPPLYWYRENAEALLMLRSYYKAGRWNLLKKMANSPLSLLAS